MQVILVCAVSGIQRGVKLLRLRMTAENPQRRRVTQMFGGFSNRPGRVMATIAPAPKVGGADLDLLSWHNRRLTRTGGVRLHQKLCPDNVDTWRDE